MTRMNADEDPVRGHWAAAFESRTTLAPDSWRRCMKRATAPGVGLLRIGVVNQASYPWLQREAVGDTLRT
jgi:hypothetical protein